MTVEPETLLSSKILIVDDDDGCIRMLERLLRMSGYQHYRSTTDPCEAVSMFRDFGPDLVLLDLTMPKMNGYVVMDAIEPEMEALGFPPILVLTGMVADDTKRRCLTLGARDLLAKPFDTVEVSLRIRNLLESRFLYIRLRDQNQQLEERVRERTAALEDAQLEILDRLAKAAEFRDDDTGEHTQRVGGMASGIGRALGMSAEQAALLQRAAPLHDIGKIGIPDSILLKPGKLTSEEFDLIKTHSVVGAKLLSGSRFPLLQTAEVIALEHHENWDGSGYPSGVKGEQIPMIARITAVADVFDALTHDRPYKKAWPRDEAMAEVERLSGTKFDPHVVEAFRALVREKDN